VFGRGEVGDVERDRGDVVAAASGEVGESFGRRAVATTWWPAFRAASVIARPSRESYR
jgi:hypothetical protein